MICMVSTEPCFPLGDNKHIEIELHTNLCAMDKIAK